MVSCDTHTPRINITTDDRLNPLLPALYLCGQACTFAGTRDSAAPLHLCRSVLWSCSVLNGVTEVQMSPWCPRPSFVFPSTPVLLASGLLQAGQLAHCAPGTHVACSAFRRSRAVSHGARQPLHICLFPWSLRCVWSHSTAVHSRLVVPLWVACPVICLCSNSIVFLLLNCKKGSFYYFIYSR